MGSTRFLRFATIRPFAMPSLIELVEQVNRGDDIAPDIFATYQQSTNAAERFLAHHAGATVGLRGCYSHLLDALTAIGYSDRKVLEQFVGLCSFLGREAEATAPTVAFGKSAVGRGEIGLGLEAASGAAAQDVGRGGAWSKRRQNLVGLSELYRNAADATGWRGPGEWSNTQPRIGYLVSALGDDEPAARAAASFAQHVDSKMFRLNVYSTEGFVRRTGQQWAGWETSTGGMVGQGRSAARGQVAHSWINHGYGATPSASRGQSIAGRLKDAGAAHWVAPADGDVLSAAKALADQIASNQTDVLIIDADVTDPVAAMVAAWKVAGRTMWIGRRSAFYDVSVDAVAYFDATAAEADRAFWQGHSIEPIEIVEGVDLVGDASREPSKRSQYGIPEAACICATAAEDLPSAMTPEMIDAVTDLLRKQPQAVYLLIGGGDTSAIRRRFDTAGVGRRVGYAGRRRDLSSFLKMADVYVCPFNQADTSETLVAMGCSLPTLALSSSKFAGDEATAEDVASWTDRASRLVREGATRRRVGQSMRRRVEQHFDFAKTAKHLQQIVATLIEPAAEKAAPAKKAA